ncbi:MAG TPA: fibronectin type III domain-containing protein, partial [Thermoplasmata archaeon]|nr:fibronectin type III domain-containing protein [Thermoplasmata archaeon]
MPRPYLRDTAGVLAAAALLILVPSVLVPPAASPAPRHLSAPNLSLVPRTEAVRFHSSYYRLQGTLVGEGASSVPIANVSVVLADQLCAGLVSPMSCTTVNSTATGPSGSFNFSTVNGSYYVYTNHSGRWGGAWAAVAVAGGGTTVALRAYPWVPYGNATFVLPAWNNLTGRADNCNAQLPCGRAPYGTQVPLLSWTQDGAVYVNATDELVFYSFANRSVTPLGPWVPLFDNLMGYPGIENTEWLTQDGSYAYELGCLSSCTNSTPVTFYALNVSTGRSFEHNFTGFTDSALYNNGQVNLVGLDGNDSIAALFLDNSSVYAYNLWNQTQWVLGDLAFFEANNVYWLPAYDRFVDVEAQGSASDRMVEYQLAGSGAGTTLTKSYSGTYESNYVSNGVDGLFVNVSSHQFLVSESKRLGDLRSELYSFDANGTITALNRSYPTAGLGVWPQDGAVPNSYSSEHRVSLVDSGPMFMGFWGGLFDNGSWLYDPATGSFLATNVSFDDNQSASANFHEEHQNPNQVEGLFFNTSYSILGASLDCQNGRDQCPIRGTLPGTRPGTVWWTWRLGLPEFPYPADAALAQPLPPSLLAITGVGNGSAVLLNWTPPSQGADPILNYTIFWGSSPTALGSVLNLPGSARHVAIGGLVPGAVIYYRAYAWNLHWHGPAANGVVTTTPRSHLIRGFAASRTPDDVGLPVYLEVNLSVPASGVNFSYYNLPAGCPSASGPELLCVPAGAGLYSITVLVDAANGTADYAN